MIDVALSRRIPIPERVILDIFLKICRAVGEMHARSPPLVHRDIKVCSLNLPCMKTFDLILSMHGING
jgi:serine/threonine protein kinase